jgi:hypothetical protein
MRGRRRWWLHHDGCRVWSYNYDRARNGSRSLGHNRPDGRSRRDCRRSWRRRNDGRRGTRLRNNLAGSGPGRRFGGRRGGGRSRCGLSCRWDCRLCRLRRSRSYRHTRVARFFLFFFLLGLDGLQNIARLGDMREVYLRGDGLRPTSRRGARSRRRACGLRKTRTYLVRLVSLQRTGVSLHALHAESGKNVQNCARLHFQFPREIVDANLTHLPLFSTTCPKR